jgi:hypothetical protein
MLSTLGSCHFRFAVCQVHTIIRRIDMSTAKDLMLAYLERTAGIFAEYHIVLAAEAIFPEGLAAVIAQRK